MALFVLSKDMVFAIVEVIYLIVIFILILSVVSFDISREVDVGEVEINTLVKKALYSEECFAYKSARTVPLIIDINKFNNKQIDNCINIEKFSSRFRLITKDKTLDAVNNENRFLVDSKACEYSNYDCVKLIKPVLVYDNGIKRGVLQIDATIYEG